METEEAQFKALFAKYLVWKASQANQTDGYRYEKTFVEFAQEFTKELVALSLQSKPEEASRKKSPNQFRGPSRGCNSLFGSQR